MKTLQRIGIFLLVGVLTLLSACSSAGNVDEDAALTAEPGSGVAITPGTMMEGTPGDMMQATPGTMMGSKPGTMMEGTPGAVMPSTGMEFDQMFIDMMVPHHQSAIEMAKIAQERSQHPEILRIAENIVNSQQQEIDQMLSWRETWYGSRETPHMSQMPMLSGMEGMGSAGQMMDMQAEVEKLRNAPEPFDLAFIDAMIPHHQQAIEAARLALEQATHAEIKEMAQKIIDDQQREIQELESLRAEISGGPAATPTP